MIWQLIWTLILLTAAAIDLRTRRIPNWLTLGGTALAVIIAALDGRPALGAAAVGAAVALAFFGLVFLLGLLWPGRSGGSALGLGDVKLALLIGAILDWPLVAPALLLGILAGGLAALTSILWRIGRRGYRPGATMAYGPYLALGGLAGLWLKSPLLTLWQAIGR